jgi:23S rRNA (uracil1939-C5)-methyltransferase
MEWVGIVYPVDLPLGNGKMFLLVRLIIGCGFGYCLLQLSLPKKSLMAISKKNRKKYYNLILENLTITGVAAEGKAIARYDELVVFINYGAPGDIVDVRVKKVERRHLEGEIIKYHHKSTLRSEPFCEHFGICGGCKWQHLSYDEQLRHKQQQVTDNLKRIGKIDYDYELVPVSGSAQTQFYRNKLEYTFADRRWFTPEEISSDETPDNPQALGFHVPGFFDKVLDINTCWLQPEPTNRIRKAVKQFAIENNMSFHNFRENSGMLRNIIIRNNGQGEFMVILVCSSEDEDKRDHLLSFIRETFPEVVSLHYMINDKKNSSVGDLQAIHYHGTPYLVEKMEGLQFKVGPKSFYQTNSQQAYALYKIARDFAGLTGSEMVYDLYTGTGTIAQFVAHQAMHVIGIEYVEEAVADARENAALNNLSNLTFFAGDMAKVFTLDFIAEHGQPDVIITDPPRAGMHPDVTKGILHSGAQRIVYVSCNPATQARDIELLSGKYKVIKVQAVDMFPHTQHVESVVLLERI